MKITCLAGGVGAAKFLSGLSHLSEIDLSVIVNVGDDFELHGLYICPDLDSVCYWLANLQNPLTGWGRANETFEVLTELNNFGGETWFTLGDKDLALHLFRTNLLRQGVKLSEITARVRKQLNITANIYPATNDILRTLIRLKNDELVPFQTYFVKLSHSVEIKDIVFTNPNALPAEGVMDALQTSDVIIICPSNPFVSIRPILEVKAIKDFLLNAKCPRVAITPIVKGKAIKGPLDRMLHELNFPVSAFGVAQYYKDLIDYFIIDQTDVELCADISRLGIKCYPFDTVMTNSSKASELAKGILSII